VTHAGTIAAIALILTRAAALTTARAGLTLLGDGSAVPLVRGTGEAT